MPSNNHQTVHSGADHQGMTLKGVNTGARPTKNMWSDPQLDMKTWKPPKAEKPAPMKPGVRLTPEQRSSIQNRKTYLA